MSLANARADDAAAGRLRPARGPGHLPDRHGAPAASYNPGQAVAFTVGFAGHDRRRRHPGPQRQGGARRHRARHVPGDQHRREPAVRRRRHGVGRASPCRPSWPRGPRSCASSVTPRARTSSSRSRWTTAWWTPRSSAASQTATRGQDKIGDGQRHPGRGGWQRSTVARWATATPNAERRRNRDDPGGDHCRRPARTRLTVT